MMFFRGKTFGVVHFMSLLFLLLNKKEKSLWLKTKKKTGPKKKKKKVSDEGWRKTLAETA